MTDLKFALRQLLKNPGFTAVAVLTLALGIGANTAIFSVVNGVLLKPLPYPSPGQLVIIRKETPPGDGPVLGGGDLVGGHEYTAWREQSQTLSQIAAYGSDDRSLTGRGTAERVRVGTATASLFPLLGVKPVLGRLFAEDEDVPNGPRVAVLSHGLWQRQFGANPGILNQTITLDGELHTVVGVLPSGFQFPDPNEVWVAMQMRRGPEVAGEGISISLVHTMARLKPEVSMARAQAELQLIDSRVTLPFSPPSQMNRNPVPAPGPVPNGELPPPPADLPKLPEGFKPPPPGDGPVSLPFPGEGKMVLRGPPPGGNPGQPGDVTQAAPPPGDTFDQGITLPPGGALEGVPFGGGGRIQLVGLHEHLVANVRQSVLVMMGAVGFVLLIACVNVANLLLTRAVSRRREFALRLALGAPRRKIIRQLLTESFVLSIAGGVLGTAFSWWGVRLLDSLGLVGAHPLLPVGIDRSVLLFTFLVAVGTGLLFGLAPALHTAGLPVNDALKEGGHTAGEGVRRHRLRGLLVMAETALALVLLVGAGLLINSFIRLRSVNVGFNPDNLMTFQLHLTAGSKSAPEGRALFAEQLRTDLATLPGVEAVAMTDHLPLTPYSIMSAVSVAGEPREKYSRRPAVSLAAVTENYFKTLGIRLKEGREFTVADRTQRAVVVNERFAREYFPTGPAVGRQLNDFAGRGGAWTIIGVVADTRQDGFDGSITPEIYTLSLDQTAEFFSTAVKYRGDSSALARAIRERVATLDANLVVYDLMTLRDRLDATVTPRRTTLTLLGSFAVLALVLAMVGIYGVMSFIVSQRTREIGVRMTLGAPASHVARMILRQGLSFVTGGLLVGLVAALVVGRSMRSLLYDIGPTDPLTLAIVSLVLIGIGAAACWLPARRAARVDPMEALRNG